MRKILLNLALSLDGLIEGPNGEYDWCFTDQDYGLTEFLGRTDAIFFGRKSYELLISTDPNPFSDHEKIVFSNSSNSIDGAKVINKSILEEIQKILSLPGKDIWLFGGAELVTFFVNNNLIDEYHLSIHPLILGEGKSLFQNIIQKTNLRHIETKTYSSGLVQIIYGKN